MHLGLVVPLPPVPAGGAEYVAALLPYLARHSELSCFVDNPDAVDPAIREKFRVRPLEERHDPDVDMLVYHIGNNPHHAFVYDAAMEGPAGIIEVHDGSMHHYLQYATLSKGDPYSYAEIATAAHGYAGKRLAEMRATRYRGSIEMFLYDYLGPVLDRAKGAIVHSNYADHLVQLRSPRTHTWMIPLFAPEFPPADPDRSWTGIGPDTLLIANLGFITPPKRPLINLQALRNVLDRGLDAHMVFVGKDEMNGRLQEEIRRLNLEKHVTTTGYVETDEMRRWTQAVDVIVNLRAPHVGESSAVLAYGLAAGKPVVVQPVGSWADFPPETVVRIPVTDDDVQPLTATLFALGQDRRLRDRFGNAARAYATEVLSADACAESIVKAAKEALDSDWMPPSWFTPTRSIGARTFLGTGSARIESLLGESTNVSPSATHAALTQVTPARPRGRLLAIDVPPRCVQLLANVWGYEVDVRTWSDTDLTLELDAQPGIPAYTLKSAPFSADEIPFGQYDAVMATAPGPSLSKFLLSCNQMLTPQGLLAMIGVPVDETTLDDFGFSTHLHPDHPGWPVKVGADLNQKVVVGTKATLPALSAIQG